MKKIIYLMIVFIGFNSFITINAFAQEEPSTLDLASEAAIILEANSGKVIYEKNAKEKMYPASLTKIATAIYAIEKGNLNDIVTISSNARETDGTRVYLEEGEQVPLKKLVQGLLINSGNDAGIAIAEHLSGSIEQFAKDINNYLLNVVGVQNTHFVNPHGLFDDEHFTTAEDLAVITQYAMHNETFRSIFGTKELEWVGASWDTTLITHHKILKGEFPYDSVTGGKTGYVNESGFTLATTASNENLSLIVITLNSSYEDAAYRDTINLLDYGFNNFKTASIEAGTTFTVDDDNYINSEPLLYTSSINDTIVSKMDKDGTLNLINQDRMSIASYQLEKMKSGEINHPVELQNTSNTGASQLLMLVIKIAIWLVVLLATVVIGYQLKLSLKRIF
ncbi:MAG TPA: D-alanyl-D-alanine carboxypeptidase family protein [Ureibacillus sp.]|nr:D-alanyl-D-alanine carboxypeptidase family protein [Ureibacillus sp.]